MAYSRTTTVDSAPAGDTTKQAVLDVDTDLTGIFTNLNTHEALTTGIHGVGAGTICGTTTTNTLTNKTLSSPTLTGTVTASGATITGGNTVNQTITTPTITGGTSTNLTLVTPALGTPTAGVLTNATGLPVSTGLTGEAAGITAFLATPSSANLATAITDETGSGALVFGTSPTIATPTVTGGTFTNPTFVNPALGTPASGVVTNLTGTAAGVTAGGIDDNTLITTPSITGGTATNLALVTPALTTPTSFEIRDGLTTTGAVLSLGTKEPTVVTDDVLGKIQFYAPLEADGGDSNLTAAFIQAVAELPGFSATQNAAGIAFGFGVSEAAVEKIRMDSRGYLGILTSLPSSPLHVVGDAYVNGNLTATGTIQATTALLTNLTDLKVPKHVADATGLADTTITVSANNEMTNASQPAFLATPSVTVSNATGDGTTVNPVVFGNEIFDQNADFASNTFTAPVTGKYLLSVNIALTDLAAGMDGNVTLVTSNRSYIHSFLFTVANHQYSINVVADMDAGDTAYVTLTVSSGTKVVDIYYAANTTYFSGCLAC